MQLRTARLCLDCDTIHETHQCPVCASPTFAFMTRWVPASERRRAARTATASSAATTAYRRLLTADSLRPKALDLLKDGSIVFAVVSFARWSWRRGRQHAAASR